MKINRRRMIGALRNITIRVDSPKECERQVMVWVMPYLDDLTPDRAEGVLRVMAEFIAEQEFLLRRAERR